jgi:lipopolysaccharide transport system ATP-binding protein
MDKETAIKVEQVSKKYCKSLKTSMLYGVMDIGRNMFRLSSHSEKLRKNEFWALADVSFEVKKGETIGIIGPNGSGKTTLLKLINGIFWPDKGKITIRGRVGALIEVGAGFHPLLTGRENIYINAAILGMTKKEVDKKLDSIIEFADIGNFIEMPVKFYSSGMFVRLGFAIAVHSEPNILLIDEVLAVGDEKFQRQCINKISQLQENGMTIVFVSHELTTVEGICSKVIWLDKGKVRTEGIPETIIDEYLCHVGQTLTVNGKKLGRRWGTREAEIVDIGFFNSKNENISRVKSGEEVTIILSVRFNKEIRNPIFGILLRSDNGSVVYGTNSRWRHINFGTFEENEEIKVVFKQKMLLTGGLYYVDPAIAYSDGRTFCDWQEKALSFIIDMPIQTMGVTNLDSQISIIRDNK